MGLKITSLSRANASPCNHWHVTIQNDVAAQTVTVRGISMADLQNRDRYDDGPWWVLLALLWLRARLAAGLTAASSLNVEIVG